MNNKESIERGGQYLKYVVGVLFLAFVSSSILLALLDTFGYEDNGILGFNSLYALWCIWAVMLCLYLLNTEPIEYPQYKETIWEARSRYVGSLCGLVFMASFYAIVSLVLLGMLLQWTLGIDITEFDKMYRLLFLAWGGWIIGFHFYFENQEEKRIQEQLGKLRRKETVQNPRSGLLERFEKEQKDEEGRKNK